MNQAKDSRQNWRRVVRKKSGRFVLCALGVAAIAACEPDNPDAEHVGATEAPVVASPADPENAAQVATGELIYQSKCAVCHGVKLEGQPNWRRELLYGGYPAPPHNGTGHTWHHADQHLFDATKLGGEASAGEGSVSHMLGFGDVLSDEEIWATIAYIKSHWPAKLRARQQQAGHGKAHSHH